MLSKNLAYLRKNKQLSQSKLAEAVGLSRATYGSYEQGTSEPNASVLVKLADYLEVTVDDLIRGDLDLPLFRQKKRIARLLDEHVRVVPVTVDEYQRQNIQYVPEAALAGYLREHNHPEYIEQLPHFRLPRLNNGTYRAFDIQGDSMPPVHNGYVLIGRFVEHERELINGNRYVLVVKEKGIVFKRVYPDAGKHSRRTERNPETAQLVLLSDNPAYEPYTVEVADVLEAWEMVAFIGFPDIYRDNTYLLNERLQLIEQKLIQLNLLS